MTKDQLLNLKKFVDNFPNELIDGDYYNTTANCFCVIGAMAKDLGLSDDYIYDLSDSISSWNSYDEVFEEEWKTLSDLQDKFGLTIDEFELIQGINDRHFESKEARARTVKQKLIEIIKEKESLLFV